MRTDRRPSRGDLREEYDLSSRLTEIQVPGSESLAPMFALLEAAREVEARKALSEVCRGLIEELSGFYRIPAPSLKLLGVRPHSTLEGLLASELLGDYNFDLTRIRLWTRTPMQKQWTSSRTILSTLCHEFMHHLDAGLLGLPRSYHTTGFFERTHLLYLVITGHPRYLLAWHPPERDGARSIDWPATNRRRDMAATSAPSRRAASGG